MDNANNGLEQKIVELVRDYYPSLQAIYLFGSHGTEHEWPDSDLDVALLLAPLAAKAAGTLAMTDLNVALDNFTGKKIDLINLRCVSTVFQKEVIAANRRIHCTDERAADEFEMLTLSLYQKLNEERAEILEAFSRSGKAYIS